MKKFFAIALFTLCCASAFAAEPYINIGGSYVDHNLKPTKLLSDTESERAATLFGVGFKIDDHLAVEVNYRQLGQVSAAGSNTFFSASCGCSIAVNGEAILKLRGVETSGLLSIGDQFRPYLRGGMFFGNSKSQQSYNNSSSGAEQKEDSLTSISPIVGAGVRYKWVSAEFARIFRVSMTPLNVTDVDVASIFISIPFR